jgi:hypothetical protein
VSPLNRRSFLKSVAVSLAGGAATAALSKKAVFLRAEDLIHS